MVWGLWGYHARFRSRKNSIGDMKMDKRISAAFVVMLFLLGVVAAPVSAHFTLGNLTANVPYRTDDWYPHVKGVIGYVWPGGGPTNWALGSADPRGYPGYQSPWPNDQPSGMRSDFYQLESGYYAPFGAILTSTIKAGTAFNKMKVSGNPTIETAGTWVEGAAIEIEHANKGDLVFALNATDDFPETSFVQVAICIPPEFKGIDRKKVVSSITNNYDLIGVSTVAMESLVDPGWTRVTVAADPDFPMVFGDGTDRWYYFRINDVTAPTIAGRYFFKIFMASAASGVGYYYPYKSDTDPTWKLDECPPQNWPVLLVKGEVDPGIITGTIKYGGWNTAYYGLPAELAGMVRAVGIADDPYTGKSTGRPVEARAYFNHTAKGHYEIEGVAPGTYDIYASMAGYPELKIASGVKVLKGQSAHVDGYLTPGVVIHGEVFSKCGTGEVYWMCSDWQRRDAEGRYYFWFSDLEEQDNQPIKIEIYKSAADAEATTAGSTSTKAISWSPMHKLHTKIIPTKQFPWPHDGANYPNGNLGFDPDGVGPSQKWQVEADEYGFKFMFGDKGLYGAPAFWTGHIPQTYATWVDGVAPGTYFMRAWTHGYVQTMADGVTFEHVSFTVASYEWPGNVYVVFDLRLGSYIVKEFHLHSIPGTLEDKGFELPFRGVWNRRVERYFRYLYVDVKDAKGTRFGWAVRQVAEDADADERIVGVRGLVGRVSGSGFLPYGRSYGIPAGTYTVKGFAAGYIDQKPATVSIGLCGSRVQFSDHLDRGVIFNITVYSVDWQHPSVYKCWSWEGENIYIMPYKDGKPLAGGSYGWTGIDYEHSDEPPPSYDGDEGEATVSVSGCYWGMPIIMQPTYCTKNYVKAQGYYGGEGYYTSTERIGSTPLAFETGQYSFKVFTYGYIQKKAFELYAIKGAYADIPIKLHQGANVTFDIAFKRESIFEHLRYDSSMRIRLFDDTGKLVGEALTSDYTKMFVNAANTDPDAKAMARLDSNGNIVYAVWRTTRQLEIITDYEDYEDREYLNFIPSSTMRVRGIIGGLPDLYSGGDNRIDVYSGYSPDPFFDMSWTGSPIPAPYGIDAAPNYKGGWYIEVDIVPWYENEFGYERPKPTYVGGGGNGPLKHFTIYYPPPPGVLTGESPKYIPENHWGPYEQRMKVVVPGAHLGGEASVIFELDLRGLLRGNVYTYTHCGDWRTTSWIVVQAVAADGKIYNWYTFDGLYELWLTPGTYSLNVIEWSPAKAEGHKVATLTMPVSEGSQLAMNFYLEQSGVPIPEFTTAALVLASALAASLFILRRKRKQ